MVLRFNGPIGFLVRRFRLSRFFRDLSRENWTRAFWREDPISVVSFGTNYTVFGWRVSEESTPNGNAAFNRLRNYRVLEYRFGNKLPRRVLPVSVCPLLNFFCCRRFEVNFSTILAEFFVLTDGSHCHPSEQV